MHGWTRRTRSSHVHCVLGAPPRLVVGLACARCAEPIVRSRCARHLSPAVFALGPGAVARRAPVPRPTTTAPPPPMVSSEADHCRLEHVAWRRGPPRPRPATRWRRRDDDVGHAADTWTTRHRRVARGARAVPSIRVARRSSVRSPSRPASSPAHGPRLAVSTPDVRAVGRDAQCRNLARHGRRRRPEEGDRAGGRGDDREALRGVLNFVDRAPRSPPRRTPPLAARRPRCTAQLASSAARPAALQCPHPEECRHARHERDRCSRRAATVARSAHVRITTRPGASVAIEAVTSRTPGEGLGHHGRVPLSSRHAGVRSRRRQEAGLVFVTAFGRAVRSVREAHEGERIGIDRPRSWTAPCRRHSQLLAAR